MAQQAPTIDELLAQIQALQAQVTALASAAPPVAPTAPVAPVVFADTPNTLRVDDIIDYKTKQGASIYERGCQALDDKALTEGFSMSMNQSVVFVEALHRKATQMGWNQGSKQITSLVNRDGRNAEQHNDVCMPQQDTHRFCPGKTSCLPF